MSKSTKFLLGVSCFLAGLVASSRTSQVQAEELESAYETMGFMKRLQSVVGNHKAVAGLVAPSSVYRSVVQSLLKDAMADGVLDTSERQLIMSQAERGLSEDELALVRSRIAQLPVPNVSSWATEQVDETKIVSGTDSPQNYSDQACGGCGACEACCEDPGCGRWFENVLFFGAVDGWRGPIDDDESNNFGLRFGANWGIPLIEKCGIGAQFGLSYGAYDFHGRDFGEERSSIEEQLFITSGIFKRANLCDPCNPDRLSYGLVYDHLVTDNLGEDGWETNFGQLRGQIGYALNCYNEVGFWGAIGNFTHAHVDGISNDSDPVRTLDQGSLYWKHLWCNGSYSTFYVGIAEDPGEFVFGARGDVPLSPSVSLFGGFHYILPSTSGGSTDHRFSEEFWNVSVGIAVYPHANAQSNSVAGRRWMPLLPVADNGTFAIEIMPWKL